ncbi:glycosyltransferase family 39 protein [Polycladidibacter hongkongensis]|uniref:glycosyltransferase family 39 protein n=1 Tax=Polycladidibacter hongkongensis TaxID=1647556 RepID=UPI0008311249|nr:glycosyltransferase family 39 protein [Pseudovibrio hongkongensis]
MPRNDAQLPLMLRPVSLVLLVLLATAARLATGAYAGLVEDEAYYRLWGLNPALGYYDHPPMVGWWIAIGQAIAGDTMLGARVLSILSAAIGSLAIWRTAYVLFDACTAGWTVLLFNASLLMGIGAILVTPDAPSVFFWGLGLWALAELQTSRNANWWLAVGLFAGLGLLSKFSGLFLGTGIVLWLVLSKENRRWFGAWQLWAGGLIAVLCFAPVLYWNAQHDWITFTKQFGRVAADTYTLRYIGEFIGAMAGLINPLTFLLICFGVAVAVRRALKGQEPYILLLSSTLPFLAYLLFHALHDRVQGNWPAPVYPALIMLAAHAITSAPAARRWPFRLGVFAAVLGFLVASLVMAHTIWPLNTTLGRKDPTMQLRGWQEVADVVRAQATATGARAIITTSYGFTGQMSEALKHDGLQVFQLNQRERYAMQPKALQSLPNGPLLYVVEDRRDRLSVVEAKFGAAQKLAEAPRKTGETVLETVRIYLLPRAN